MVILCVNDKCVDFKKENFLGSVIYKMIDGKLTPTCNLICDKCGEKMIEKQDDIPIKDKNINYGKFSSLSKEDRVNNLKDRSHEHFNKKIKKRKNYLWDQISK